MLEASLLYGVGVSAAGTRVPTARHEQDLRRVPFEMTRKALEMRPDRRNGQEGNASAASCICPARRPRHFPHARIPSDPLLSTGVVTAGEIGDKTMLMAICLAARFRRPAPIIWGILVATVLNHAMAGGAGALLASLITPDILRWILIVSFAAMARLDADPRQARRR